MSESISQLPAAVRPTIEAARKTVRLIAPDASEVAYQMAAPRSRSTMWKLARYAIAGSNVVGLGTFTSHSALFFYRGRELDDGSGLLSGSGKDMRFIRLSGPQDANRPEVKKLLARAFRLQRGS